MGGWGGARGAGGGGGRGEKVEDWVRGGELRAGNET